jgi:TetR/AcrR family transcriptional regulator, transcriptional repressor for nem operon
MGSPRRVGSATSKTRDALLDCVERLMFDEGYAAVTYRAVAARAGVASSLVQYYFPTLDDVFLAAMRRRSEQNLARLAEALAARPDQPLHVLWEYSREEATAALMAEFLALGNHRKSIRAEIGNVMEEVRQLQLDTLAAHRKEAGAGDDDLAPEVLVFLLNAVPKMIRLEEVVGVTTTHADVVAAFTDYLDALEPPPDRKPPPSSSRRKLL